MKTRYFVPAALAMLIVAGCGREDLTELDTRWGSRETAVVEQLNGYNTKRGELEGRFMEMKYANTTDSTKLGELTAIERTLQEQQAAVVDLQKSIDELKARRDAVLKLGKKSEYNAGWKDAEPRYNAIATKITELDAGMAPLRGRIDALSAQTTPPPTGALPDAADPTIAPAVPSEAGTVPDPTNGTSIEKLKRAPVKKDNAGMKSEKLPDEPPPPPKR